MNKLREFSENNESGHGRETSFLTAYRSGNTDRSHVYNVTELNDIGTPVKYSYFLDFLQEKQLKDVASAVAEVVTILPAVPVRPDSSSKYTDVIRNFVSELLKVKLIELLIMQ